MFSRTALTTTAVSAALLLSLTGCSSSAIDKAADFVPVTDAPAADAPAADAPTEEAPAEEAPAEPATPGLNTPVTVGTFEFTATGFSEIGPTIGDAPLSSDAQGTYLQVDLSVKNLGKKSETFLSNYVKLVDAAGNTYDSDTMAAIYADSQTSWVTGINPGNAAAGPIIFDVPAGTQAVSILVSDSMFDDGTPITLK